MSSDPKAVYGDLVRLAQSQLTFRESPSDYMDAQMRGYVIGCEMGKRTAGGELLAALLMHGVVDLEQNPADSVET